MVLCLVTTWLLMVRWRVVGALTWGAGGLVWMAWGIIQCALAPAHAFILLSSVPAYSKQFEIGTVYRYVYETSVLLNEPLVLPVSTTKDVGFKIELQAEVTPLWENPASGQEQILQLTISVPSLFVKSRQGPSPEGFTKKPSRLDSFSSHPLFLHWNGGSVSKVYHVDGDELSMLNIKKGVASLMQHQSKDIVLSEVDASGRCDVTYKLVDSTHITKNKKNCQTVSPVIFYNSTTKVLGALITSQASTSYELSPDNKTLRTVTGVETHFLRPEARKQTGSEVMSRQLLQLQGHNKASSHKYSGTTVKEVVKSVSKGLRRTLVAEDLSTKPEPKECINCKSLKDLVSTFHSALTPGNLATQSSAIAFLRILKKVRDSNMDTIKKVLLVKKNAKILPQLLDIVAAAQTVPSHKAAMAVLDFNGPIDLPEHYLLGVSLATHPPEFIIQDLLKLAKKGMASDKLYETLMLTIASCCNNFAKRGTNANKSITREVKNMLVMKLDDCSKEPCQLTFIRALKNLQNKATIPVLLQYAKGTAQKPAIYAMRALQTMPDEYLSDRTLKELEVIFFELDKPHDWSVRAVAATLLLHRQPSEELLASMMSCMGSQKTKELNTLLLGRIKDLQESSHCVHKLLPKVLKNPKLGNYHILGQNGLSSAFSRPLAQGYSANSSFTNMLEINKGLLKRSTVDVFVDIDKARMPLLSFAIFAGGLGMFNSDEAEDDGEEANAGIEITLLSTQLRPFVFFTGQGELMGHVWAGTGSERTTALQGSLLLHDHSQMVPLQNGFNVDLVLTGVISYDFAGQVQMSLWNRDAHSLVEVGSAVVVQGQSRVDNAFVQTMIEFNTGFQTQLNFITDLNFYDDIAMCLRMVQPEFEVIDNLRKLERIPGSNYVLRKYKRKSTLNPGRTYVMNKKNTELCNKMFNK